MNAEIRKCKRCGYETFMLSNKVDNKGIYCKKCGGLETLVLISKNERHDK